jgi:DNA ligase 1
MLSKNQSYPRDNILDDMPYPCMEQPKLDGVCLIAVVNNGKASLWSRTQKPKRAMPHIVKALEELLPGAGRTILHGEAYNHAYKDRFEDLVGIINSDEPDEAGLYKEIQFHVYDLPEALGITYETRYQDRYSAYQKILRGPDQYKPPLSTIVIPVNGHFCESFAQLRGFYDAELLDGYEGSMAIDLSSPYKPGRTWAKRKMKEFEDGEMIILEVLDGRGKDAGLASKIRGEFTGPTGKKVIVEPSIACSYDKKREYWEKREYLKGKKATIKFKRLTADGVPYIPSVIWKALRDYE